MGQHSHIQVTPQSHILMVPMLCSLLPRGNNWIDTGKWHLVFWVSSLYSKKLPPSRTRLRSHVMAAIWWRKCLVFIIALNASCPVLFPRWNCPYKVLDRDIFSISQIKQIDFSNGLNSAISMRNYKIPTWHLTYARHVATRRSRESSYIMNLHWISLSVDFRRPVLSSNRPWLC